METTESPLEVLSRAAVMLQRNVLPPPSYDEARSLCSLSQQSPRKCKSPLKYKSVINEVSIVNPTSTLTYDQIGNNLSISNHNDRSGKWKREKKHQQNKIAAASALASILSDHKKSNKYSRSNSSSSNNSIENGAEPLDMSKRPSTKERGEPPSYFQSMMNSKYTRQRSDISPAVVRSSDDSSNDEEAMCDDVVNEHFRRSLGQDYVNVFSSNKKHDNQISDSQTSSEEVEHNSINERSNEGLSVDDHFAKALGDTWIKLQQQEKRISNQNSCKLNDQTREEKNKPNRSTTHVE